MANYITILFVYCLAPPMSIFFSSIPKVIPFSQPWSQRPLLDMTIPINFPTQERPMLLYILIVVPFL